LSISGSRREIIEALSHLSELERRSYDAPPDALGAAAGDTHVTPARSNSLPSKLGWTLSDIGTHLSTDKKFTKLLPLRGAAILMTVLPEHRDNPHSLRHLPRFGALLSETPSQAPTGSNPGAAG